MKPHIAEQIEALEDLTVAELRERYAEVFGEETRSRHKTFLRKRIAWRLQANEEGGLLERALRRARELANEADLRLLAPRGRTETHRFRTSHDRRLPMPGAVITREYRGRTVSVTILDDGFEYEGELYRSLTAIAKAVTGTHWNGFLFFGLGERSRQR
ncbi:MAG: DUF2924 domain-containing protein [Candidatus Eisenbacteria bacterium]|nr:DUF2924 domain-containing protein [Candidatus Eisenbacteria bacterium]